MNLPQMPHYCKTDVSRSPSIEIVNSDCVEVLKSFEDNYFDLAICDPPYGIGAGIGTGRSGKDLVKKGKVKGGNWDLEIPNDEYFAELFRVSKNQIIWGGELLWITCNEKFCNLG